MPDYPALLAHPPARAYLGALADVQRIISFSRAERKPLAGWFGKSAKSRVRRRARKIWKKTFVTAA
ncbi:MAG: hypothetical protein R3C69_03660 [Geminicoccaceae bacterium]